MIAPGHRAEAFGLSLGRGRTMAERWPNDEGSANRILRRCVSIHFFIVIPKGTAMPPVISIVGKSGSGKTTLLEKLIPELKRRGLRVGTIKHTHHGFDMDREGKDSARHKAAGADGVIVASPNRIAMVRDMPSDAIDGMLPFFADMDLVVTEGYKHGDRPKIEIHRAATGKTPLYDGVRRDIVALVTDADLEATIPRFGLDEADLLAMFIVERMLGSSGFAERC
jgi:molybdopterin-guanine dinucleotide biosynthesis adapter protein